MNTDHVVMLHNTSTLKCLHCGVTFTIVMPTAAEYFVKIVDGFIETHTDCEAKDD